jgi:peptidoglycan/LPS O-acetylase OafA/YrhL
MVIYGHARVFVKDGPPDFVTTSLGYGFTGGLAVQAFFVISGFLVTASALKGDPVFYAVSRCLRIFPALWVCVALTAFVIGPMIATGAYSWHVAWQYFWHIATTYAVDYTIPGVFDNAAVNGVLWSVIVEVRMYVLTLVLSLLGVLSRRSLFNGLFFLLLIASYFVSMEAILPFASSPTDRKLMLLFLVGAFAWINRDTIPITAFGVLVCLFALAAAHGTPKYELVHHAAFPYLLFACAFGPKWPWPKSLGDYSYGVYLWGWPIQQGVAMLDPNMTVVQNRLWAIPLALLAGAASWHLIEAPALAQKQRLTAAIKGAWWRTTTQGQEPVRQESVGR